MIFGNYIMLNMFLAILLGNFQESREKIEKEKLLKLLKYQSMTMDKAVKESNKFIAAEKENVE